MFEPSPSRIGEVVQKVGFRASFLKKKFVLYFTIILFCVTPTCVAPRHVDASREFFIFIFYFLRTSSALGGGGGGNAAKRFRFSFFPCSADHERDWPPCKVAFFGLATNALNVRNNNNNNNNFCGSGLYFFARTIQPFISLIDREVEFCVLTI